MSLQALGRSAFRVTKNYTKGYSHTQIKARNATCNDPWPPAGKEMYELAQMTYNQNDFVEIMEVIDKRLNDKGKNWRHVFKALVVLDYLLHSGSENVIQYCEDNLYEIKTLREFQYIDEDGRDQGANVRRKAADITNLLVDKQRLFRERQIRSQMRDRMVGRTSADTEDEDEGYRRYRRRHPLPNGSQRVADEEDEDLKRAIEESKRTAAQEHATAEDKDLERAIKLSQEDEEMRKKLEDANAAALFDDSNQLPPPVVQTQPLIDASLPLQYATTGLQSQFTAIPPQLTSFQPQFTSVQPQFTAIPPQFTSLQPQFTSYNPYAQQAQQEALQAEYLRQQAELAQQQLQAQPSAQPTAQAFYEPSPLVPQPTAFGSNNPFVAHPTPSSPTLLDRPWSLPPRDAPVSFNLPGTYEGRSPPRRASSGADADADADVDVRAREDGAFLRPFSTGSEPPRKMGGERENARLASLFANFTGDGVDTFGNVGQLRFGQTQYGRLAVQKTGGVDVRRQSHNPFLQSPPPLSGQAPSSQQQTADSENLIEL